MQGIMTRKILILTFSALLAVSCGDYDQRLDEMQRQIDDLVTTTSRINENVAAMKAIVEAIQAQDEVVSLAPVTEGGKIAGYTVTFKQGGSVTVYNSTANVSVGEYEGRYYWMVDGDWLKDSAGNKIEACAGAATPQFVISDGIIRVSLDGGRSWTDVGRVGVAVLASVEDGPDAVTLVLASGARIVLPKQKSLSVTLSTNRLSMGAGSGRTIGYTITGGTDDTQVITYAKDGWSATVSPESASEGYITVMSPGVASESAVLVFVSDNTGRSIVTQLTVVSTK